MSDSFGRAALQERVDSLRWFHQIELAEGVVTPGVAKLDQLQAQADIYFAGGIAGLSVLDIGCWDGFNSLAALRRGAARVVAADHWVWAHHDWASRATIELVREHAAPALEIIDIDVPDIAPERIGTFDLVLFCGVLYHLRDPFVGLARAAAVARATLVVETHLDAETVDRPAAIFYPGAVLNNDTSNWWGPNRACVQAMLQEVGFAEVEYTPHPTIPSRGIFRAHRQTT